MPLKEGQKSRYDICLTDGRSGQEWFLKLDGGGRAVQRSAFSPESFALDIRQQGKRVGDFDEQRSWRGGRGNEYFSEDPESYFDSQNAWTMTGHAIPTMKWYLNTGGRTINENAGADVRFKKLLDASRYIADSFPATAQTAKYSYMWIRRRGNPGTLTFEICSDDGGNPGTVLKTVTHVANTLSDLMSRFLKFTWSGTQSLSGSTTYHVKVYGASTDNDNNYWEVGVDPDIDTGQVSSNNSSWVDADGTTVTVGTFGLHYRVSDADTAGRWIFWTDGSDFFKVIKKDSGNSVVYKWNESTDVWDAAGGTSGLGTVVSRPVYYNGSHYFPQGGTNIRRWDGATTWAADGTNKADFLEVGHDTADGPVIWRGRSSIATQSFVSRGTVPTTDIVFNSAIPVGDKGYAINGIKFVTGNGLNVWKSNSYWTINNDRAVFNDVGLDKTPSSLNGIAAVGHNHFIYWNWMFSLERTYGDQTDDIGMGWRGPALPDGREGYISALTTYMGWVFYAIDAGVVAGARTKGLSSVYAWDGLAHHEIFRGWANDIRIRDIAIQPVASPNRTRLWIDCGVDTVYMELPLNKANPLYDAGCRYHHEFSVTSSTIDMGTASKLSKFINALTATTKNLDGSGIRVEADVQFDQNVGLDGIENWISLGAFLKSPEDTVRVNRGDITQFRYRLRAMTDDSSKPPDISGVVPTGFARSDFRIVWNMRIVTGKGATDADKLDDWLLEAASFPGRVHMTSKWRHLHDYYVIVAPPSSSPLRIGKRNRDETGVYSISLMGAEA
jgi:hypothetical protein